MLLLCLYKRGCIPKGSYGVALGLARSMLVLARSMLDQFPMRAATTRVDPEGQEGLHGQ